MPSMKTLAQRSVRGWGAVLAGGILLTLLALADVPAGTVAPVPAATPPAGASAAPTPATAVTTDCRLQVTAPELKARTAPSVTADAPQTLTQGAVVDGLPEVTDGFRHLKDNLWAANEFLVPVAGTSC